MNAWARRNPMGARRGGALVLALIVVMSVSAISLGLLRITHSSTARQGYSVDDKRAFYLAEAGLTEAYFGLSGGNSGQIASADVPALAGDGMVWVDAEERPDGLLVLRSTGLCNAGRATLQVTVRRETQPVGIFADEEIGISDPVLLDGFDPEELYMDQVGPGVLTIDPSYPFLTVDYKNKLLFYEEHFYRFYDVVGNDFYFDAMLDYVAHPLPEVQWDDFIDGDMVKLSKDDDDDDDDDDWSDLRDQFGAKIVQEDFLDVEYEYVLEYFAGVPPAVPGVQPDASQGTLGPTTGGGGVLGSNGPISLSGGGTSFTLYGDAIPGPDSSVSTGPGVAVAGNSTPRSQPLELSEVRPPGVELFPPIHHDSAIPKVIPPGEVGYEGLYVAPGSELLVQGPGALVVQELELDDQALLEIGNAAGQVDLYVTGSALLAPGSRLLVESTDPGDLSLQGAPSATELALNATGAFYGVVYAPDSHVQVGSDFELFGALVANTLELAPAVRLHTQTGDFTSSAPLPRVVSWKIDEIPARVRQDRSDPMRLLALAPEDLTPLAEAHERSSWYLTVSYKNLANQTIAYEGPFEDFPYQDAQFYLPVPFPRFDPPAESFTQTKGSWTIDLTYKDLFGGTKTFSGTMEQFVAAKLPIIKVLDRVMTRPQ